MRSQVGGGIWGLDPIRVGTTWLVFVAVLPFLESAGIGLEGLVGGGLLGLALVIFGFLAASRCRKIPDRDNARRAKLALLSVLLGVGVGAGNFASNMALSVADTSIRELLLDHFAQPLTWGRVASVAVVEEVLCRLFVMSVAAWVAARFLKDARTVFLTALIVSAFVFAVPHLLGRPMPPDTAFAALYAVGVVVKSGLAGFVLGWVFWRWGLPYAITIHFIANGLHQLLEPFWF